jgi:hypothetical protein
LIGDFAILQLFQPPGRYEPRGLFKRVLLNNDNPNREGSISVVVVVRVASQEVRPSPLRTSPVSKEAGGELQRAILS